MTDEEMAFRAEVSEKSKLAQSARRAANMKGRGCRLPSDGKTRKELESMNGPVHTIKLGVPMTWEEFRGKPETLQKEYIADILAQYEIGPAALAKMFGISKQHCGSYLRGLGFYTKKRPLLAETNRFLAEFGKETSGATISEGDTVHLAGPIAVEQFAITFSGPFRADEIAAKLATLFPDGADVTARVEVAKR